MNIVEKKLSELTPYKNNPRHNDEAVEYVANSIKEFGFKVPIVIDKDGVIVAGHTRFKAAKKLKLKTVPCIVADDLTPEQVNAFRLADNKTAELAYWDVDLLDLELDDISSIDMSQFGFEVDLDEFDEGEEFPDDEDYEPTEKDTNKKWFADKEIEQAIIDGWQEYKSAEEFCRNAIDEASAMWQFNRLCQGYRDGYHISALFNPHRLDASTNHSQSVFQAWNNYDKYKANFARYAVEVGERVPPRCEYYKLAGIGFADVQFVNEFQPYLARDIYKTYCKNGDRILNPCAGWGGRLIGIASCMFDDIEYWETDPQTETYNGLVKLKAFLKLSEQYKQFNLPFEELEVPENYFDFAFTSPPYFDTERYSDEATQSYVKFDSYDKWAEGFLKPMIDKILYALKPKGRCLLNVGNCRYPIDKTIEIHLHDKGIKSDRVMDFKIGGSGIGARTGEGGEPFILFQKP